MKPKKAIWIFFAIVVGVQIVFWLSPLQFKYSIYSFEINAVVIVLFSISLAFLFKRRWVRIVSPILSLVLLGGIWGLLLLRAAFGCGDYDVNSIEIDNYVIRQGAIGCWSGPATHSFEQLERKVAGDLITYVLERNEDRGSEKTYDNEPGFSCDIIFERSNLTFDRCEQTLKD